MYINHIYKMIEEITKGVDKEAFVYHNWNDFGRATFTLHGIRVVAQQGFFGRIKKLTVYPFMELKDYNFKPGSEGPNRYISVCKDSGTVIPEDKITKETLEKVIHKCESINTKVMAELRDYLAA